MDSVTTFSVPGIVWGGCADSIERVLLQRMEGTGNVTVNVPAKTVTVTHDDERLPVAQLIAALNEAGFAAEPITVPPAWHQEIVRGAQAGSTGQEERPPVLTLSEVARCEGYYYDTQTGDLLRNVGPEAAAHCCWAAGSEQDAILDALPDIPRFVLVTSNVLAPFADVERMVREQFGAAAPLGRIVNRRSALQPDGSLLTGEAQTERRGGAGEA